MQVELNEFTAEPALCLWAEGIAGLGTPVTSVRPSSPAMEVYLGGICMSVKAVATREI